MAGISNMAAWRRKRRLVALAAAAAAVNGGEAASWRLAANGVIAAQCQAAAQWRNGWRRRPIIIWRHVMAEMAGSWRRGLSVAAAINMQWLNGESSIGGVAAMCSATCLQSAVASAKSSTINRPQLFS